MTTEKKKTEKTKTAQTGTKATKRQSKGSLVGRLVIVRSYGAGVFFGRVVSWDSANKEVVLDECRRLWRWTGASLSQVARDGIGQGENKFSVRTNSHVVTSVLELIPTTVRAAEAINGVPEWIA